MTYVTVEQFLKPKSEILTGIVFFSVALIFSCSSTMAQSSVAETTNWRIERAVLDNEFADRLEEIGKWCRDNDIPQQVEPTFKLHQARDLQRQYIFLPPETSLPKPPEGILGKWLTKINEVKIWQAERIFELAKRAATAEQGGAAFRFLNEVLYYNRDHAEVRKILGHRKTDDGWRVAPQKLDVRLADRPHDLCQWPARSYQKVITPHFEIDSNANEAQTRHLAEQLERWHDVWRQVFFDYWGNAKHVQRWIEGKSQFRHAQKRFRVVFFQHRQDYVAQLAPIVRGVEASTGYYSSDQGVSFFYDDTDSTVEDTWRHELTHQLFREAINTPKGLFDDEFIWLDEGIATYFESLTDFGDYVTLGGFEARRIQYARIRLLLENFYVPLAELSALGRVDLQERPDMVRLYSQVAGLTDMLMNDQDGAYEHRLGEFLQMLYKGRKIRAGAFEEMLGQSYVDLDKRYRQFLIVDSNRVARHLSQPLSRTEISLAEAGLTDSAFFELGKCHNLSWLDLSKNRISKSQLEKLKSCQRLTQLFLTECPLEPGSLLPLAQFSKLDDLDLSGSSVSDEQLRELSELSSLTSLRLTATRISDDGLIALSRLSKLKSLDLTRTKVTAAGIAKLKQQLPQLEVTH